MDEELNESLWLRIKGKAGTGNIIVGVCYRPPEQEDRANEALYRQQIGVASRSEDLVLMGDLITPISVGGSTQQGISNPGGTWNALMISSFSK